jgi:hypothetical protein
MRPQENKDEADGDSVRYEREALSEFCNEALLCVVRL